MSFGTKSTTTCQCLKYLGGLNKSQNYLSTRVQKSWLRPRMISQLEGFMESCDWGHLSGSGKQTKHEAFAERNTLIHVHYEQLRYTGPVVIYLLRLMYPTALSDWKCSVNMFFWMVVKLLVIQKRILLQHFVIELNCFQCSHWLVKLMMILCGVTDTLHFNLSSITFKGLSKLVILNYLGITTLVMCFDSIA